MSSGPVAQGEDIRRLRWERATEWPLVLAALLFLVAYAWPILDPGLGDPWHGVSYAVTGTVWVVFAVDYAMRLILAEHRGAFVRLHLFDLLVVVLPLLRPLRLLRLLTVLAVFNRHAGTSLRARVVVYGVGGTVLVTFVAALALLEAERDVPGSRVASLGDALWWAFVTTTTVGYGDTVPVTSRGRVIAIGLMVLGISFLGVVTAAFASWLVERVQAASDSLRDDMHHGAATSAQVDRLIREVAELRAQLTGPTEPGDPPGDGAR